MSIFSRAHSGNLNAYKEALFKWDATEYEARHESYYSPVRNRMHHWVELRHRETHEVFCEVDLSDNPHAKDEDVMCIAVATWLNTQFWEYMSWK